MYVSLSRPFPFKEEFLGRCSVVAANKIGERTILGAFGHCQAALARNPSAVTLAQDHLEEEQKENHKALFPDDRTMLYHR